MQQHILLRGIHHEERGWFHDNRADSHHEPERCRLHAELRNGPQLPILMKAFLIIPILLSSCVVANKDMVASLGGKMAYKSRDFAVTSDHEASFREAAMLATAAVGAWASVASTEAAEATSRAVNANSTKQAINASNNATAVQLGAQAADVEKAKILAVPAP